MFIFNFTEELYKIIYIKINIIKKIDFYKIL